MKAIILVGGEGTRLRPLTFNTPKQMLPVVGVPMIERVVGHLAVHGVDEVVLSLGYLPDAFMSAYPSGSVGSVPLSYAIEPEPYDTAGAVKFAATTAGVEDTFLVLNGDVLTDVDVTALVSFHRQHQAEGTIHLYPVDDPSAFGVVPTDDHGRVLQFMEKPRRDEAPTNLINAGTYVLEPAVLDRIPLGRRVSIERETFPAMAKEGLLFAKADDAYWLDTGTPAAYLQAHRDLLSGRRGFPPAPSARQFQETSWARGEVKIEGSVVGACFFDEGATVSSGATVRDGFVGSNCVIEDGATVTGSVLLSDVRVASQSDVSDSVLGNGAVVGERCSVTDMSVLGPGAVVPFGTTVQGERVSA